jgi:hypothetical protein
MRMPLLALPVFAALALSGCMTPIGPVEVTRFHQQSAAQQLGQGTIAIAPAPGMDPNSLELGSYKSAVSRELVRLGYTVVESGPSGQVALVRLERNTLEPGDRRGPVSVGVGGSTGSYGSGVGLGIGFDLSGKPKPQVLTQLGVMIQDRASNQTIWEGRASFAVSSSAPLAQSQLAAPKMATALFKDFPGNNGETVEVK